MGLKLHSVISDMGFERTDCDYFQRFWGFSDNRV